MPMAFTVRVLGTLIGPLYRVEEAVGVEPSTVYRMVEPAVAVEIVTVCAVAYCPPAGLNVGVATGVAITYDAVATAEVVDPALSPIAFTVVLAEMLIGPLYRVEDAVGVEPSTVYRMVEPAVAVEIVTDCVVGYVPPAGLNVGVATVLVPPPCV
jgi:hypothetical protein